MIELSSLTASVTLGRLVNKYQLDYLAREYIHQLVGLLLLLEDGRRGVILLFRLGARDVASSKVSLDPSLRGFFSLLENLRQVDLLLVLRLGCHGV